MQYLTQHPEQKGTQKGYFCFVCLSVVNSCRETPGPIPNPEAKPAHADGTATGRLWESKSPPTPNNNEQFHTETTGKETVNHRLLPFFAFYGNIPHATVLHHTRLMALDPMELHTPGGKVAGNDP